MDSMELPLFLLECVLRGDIALAKASPCVEGRRRTPPPPPPPPHSNGGLDEEEGEDEKMREPWGLQRGEAEEVGVGMGMLREALGEQLRGTKTQRYRSSSGEESSGRGGGRTGGGGREERGSCETLGTSTE